MEKENEIINRMKYIANSVMERVIMLEFNKQQADFKFTWTESGLGKESILWQDLPEEFKASINYDFIIESGNSKPWLAELKKIDYPPSFFKENKFYITARKIKQLIQEAKYQSYIPYIIAHFKTGELYFFNLSEIWLDYDSQKCQVDDHNNFHSKEKTEKEVVWLSFKDATIYKLENYNEERYINRTLQHCYKKTNLNEYLTLNIKKPK